MRVARDDLGNEVPVAGPVRRVVSLVPSLTETVAACDVTMLAGITRWCSHPAGLAVPRLGGTKNPDVPGIIALAPDLVLANDEENRDADLAALRAAGVPVWVTRIRSLPDALASLHRMIRRDRAERLAIVPIWRRPWMVLGGDTFAGDLLARLGVGNVFAAHEQRYPKIALADLQRSGADLVVLPDEPYRFTADDGPDAFPGMSAALVSGRHLTWYGPSLAQAPDVLSGQLGAGIVE